MSTLCAELARHKQEVPDQVCLTLLFSDHQPQQVTYRELWDGAAHYAAALQAAGIAPGEVVILILNHGLELVQAFFGVVQAGAVPSIMPFLTEKLDPDHYRRSLASLISVTQPAAAITFTEFTSEVQQAAGEGSALRAVLESERIAAVPARASLAFAGDPLPGMQRQDQDIALLQHSSGTTGLQKGVALSHRAVFNQLNSYRQALRLTNGDVVVSWLPLYHDMGLVAGFLLPVLLRIPLVLLSPFDWVRAPVRLLQAASDYRATLTWLPNFAYNFCAQKIRERELDGIDLSSLRAVINCSEPMVLKSHEMFLARFAPYGLRASALATSYAMAENVFAVTQGGVDAPVNVDWIDAHRLTSQQLATPSPAGDGSIPMLSAGKPIGGTQLRVLDPAGNSLPERQIGELAIHSSCMLSGYYHRPDLTQKAFIDGDPGGWYLTGDLGYLAAGEVYITGRKKDLIIVGGKNIYPQDLENIANEVAGIHPGRVAAFGVFNERSGTEEVVIVAETDVSGEDERQRVADELRRRVTRGSDVALRYVHLVERDWLLKTSSGKVARSANREKYLQEQAGK